MGKHDLYCDEILSPCSICSVELFLSFNVFCDHFSAGIHTFTHKAHLGESQLSIMSHFVISMFMLFLVFVSQVKSAELMTNYADKNVTSHLLKTIHHFINKVYLQEEC